MKAGEISIPLDLQKEHLLLVIFAFLNEEAKPEITPGTV